jgi:hypothetical protein
VAIMASRPPGDRDVPTSDGEPTSGGHAPLHDNGLPEQPPPPDAARPSMAHAAHTRTCSYLLDERGVCRWIVSRQGAVPSHVNQCVGAQFVACLDLATQGGLVGDLRAGAMALFVRNSEPGRMVLLRTAPIESVDGLSAQATQTNRAGQGAQRGPVPAFGDHALQQGMQYGKRAGVPVGAPPPAFGAVESWGAEQTVTVATTVSDGPSRGDDEQ